MLGIISPSLNEGKLQNFPWDSDANANKLLMDVYMEFNVSFELYINIRTRNIPNMKTGSVYHCNQETEKTEKKCNSLH